MGMRCNPAFLHTFYSRRGRLSALVMGSFCAFTLLCQPASKVLLCAAYTHMCECILQSFQSCQPPCSRTSAPAVLLHWLWSVAQPASVYATSPWCCSCIELHNAWLLECVSLFELHVCMHP
jgi:hypothetical protein